VTISLAGWLFVSSSTNVGAATKSTHSNVLNLGLDSCRAEDTCVGWIATARSGDFFASLHMKKNSGNSQYWIDGKEIKSFPPSITLHVVAAIDKCDRPASNLPEDNLHVSINDELMESLVFNASWNDGLKSQNAGVALVSKGKFKDMPRGSKATWWEYVVTVQTKNIPIQDPVRLKILSPSGIKLAQFVVRL